MLDYEEAVALAERIALGPDYRLEIRTWRAWGGAAPGWGEPRLGIEISKYRRDTETGLFGWGHGGWYLLESRVTAAGFIQRVFRALLSFEEHELREGFLFDGKPVLGPHRALDV